MKLFESNIRDTVGLWTDDGVEIAYFNIEWSYIVSVSFWLPLSILLVSLFADSLISLSWNYLTESYRNALKTFEKDVPVEENENVFTEKSVFAERRQIVITDRAHAEKMYDSDMEIDKTNECCVAFKYLCTCLPGNKILARKPLRMSSDKTMEDNPKMPMLKRNNNYKRNSLPL